MKAHFSEGIDLSNQENLMTIVEQQGLDSEKASEILNSEAFDLEVTRDLNKSNALGITGVPYFLINGKQVISGAQSDNVFEQTISKALKEVNH